MRLLFVVSLSVRLLFVVARVASLVALVAVLVARVASLVARGSCGCACGLCGFACGSYEFACGSCGCVCGLCGFAVGCSSIAHCATAQRSCAVPVALATTLQTRSKLTPHFDGSVNCHGSVGCGADDCGDKW